MVIINRNLTSVRSGHQSRDKNNCLSLTRGKVLHFARSRPLDIRSVRTFLLLFLCWLIAIPSGQAGLRTQNSDCSMAEMMEQVIDDHSESAQDCCHDMARSDIQCNMEMPCGTPSFLAVPIVRVTAAAKLAKPIVEPLPLSPPRLNLSSIWRPPNLI